MKLEFAQKFIKSMLASSFILNVSSFVFAGQCDVIRTVDGDTIDVDQKKQKDHVAFIRHRCLRGLTRQESARAKVLYRATQRPMNHSRG